MTGQKTPGFQDDYLFPSDFPGPTTWEDDALNFEFRFFFSHGTTFKHSPSLPVIAPDVRSFG